MVNRITNKGGFLGSLDKKEIGVIQFPKPCVVGSNPIRGIK